MAKKIFKIYLMKKWILIAIIGLSLPGQAQVYRERIGFDLESIAHIDIGWMQMRTHTTLPKAKQLADRFYSAEQIGYCQQMVEWMQASYLPKGCLGDATYYQNFIPKFSATNSLLGNYITGHAQALPLMYGAQTKVYMFLKKDAQGKFVPQNNLGDQWNIEANSLQHISIPVSFISSKDEYYFMMPGYGAPKEYNDADKAKSNLLGFDKHKNLQPYQHLFMRLADNAQYVVIMTKNNKPLPFEEVTIGEFLTQAETQFPTWQKIANLSPEKYAIAQKNLAGIREKYKNKLNNIARLTASSQVELYSFVNANEGNNDMFNQEENGNSFPILKVSKSARELSKKNEPQWIVIRWQLGMDNESYYLHLHESILNNFNYDYAYNFFFNPEKIKGQAYKPLRSPNFKEAVLVKPASEKSKELSADKNAFFFEDFSTSAIGKKPIGWQAKLANAGTTAVVTTREGLDGNWLELRGHLIKSTALKNPVPQNFKLSYDLVAAKDFTWGAKGLTMLLAKESSLGNPESFIKLKLRPGSGGNDGEAMLETKFPSPPGYSNGSKWYAANGFSNNKENNKVTVTIQKMDEKLVVYIDKVKIAEYEKAIPSAHLFNALSFDCGGNSTVNDTYYISNIKISKE